MLLAVMERGAERFFADLPDSDRRVGRPAKHLRTVVSTPSRRSSATRTSCAC